MNQNETQEQSSDEPQNALGGKYLSFLLKEEEYGVRILKVREIIAIQDVTPLPRMPDYVRGVINLRGRIIPIVDLRLKLNMEAPPDTAQTCIIVLEVSGVVEGEVTQIGCVVDTVSEVLDITSAQVEPPPRFGAAISTEYILGLGKIADKDQEKVLALVDIDKVLCQGEVAEITREISEEAATSPA